MAITISESPQVYNPVYNPVVWTVLSTNSGQSNMQYILDLYVNGSGTKLKRFFKPPDNDNGGRAFFDMGAILKGYTTQNILRADAGFATNANSYVRFTAKFGEQYGPSSGITEYADLTVDSERYAYNAVFDSPDYRDYEDDDWVLAAVNKKFLTNFPDSGKVRSADRQWVYMLTSGTNVVDHMVVRTYDSADALIQTIRFNNQYKSILAGSENNRFLRFPIGTNMNTITDTILQGSLPVLTASVSKYTIQTNNATSGITSELRTYKIDDACTIHDTYTFHFLNKHGGFDTFTFIRRSDKPSTVERSQYKKIQGVIGGDSTKAAGTWGYDNSDRGRVNFFTRIEDRITVHSDWVDEATMAWLEELVYSPEVYLDDSTNGFVAVNILNAGFDPKQTVNEKLFNLTLEFQYGYQRYRQSR